MDQDDPSPGPLPVADLDRRLLQLLKAGHSSVEAGELAGLTVAGTAVRLQALRTRLGVTSTAAAIDVVCRSDPPSSADRRH
ncbi:MAG: hypothetical protein EON55_29115 [Alphaproteobacteria bacterium]|nr:MAG: hypothetical protein EON55_29115 [Alphaproteobacteria bacterium]